MNQVMIMKFEDVYNLVKRCKDEEEFQSECKKLGLEGAALNPIKGKRAIDVTPIYQLAFDRDYDRVEWLLNMGVEPIYAAAGYARGNYIYGCNEIITKYYSGDYNSTIKSVRPIHFSKEKRQDSIYDSSASYEMGYDESYTCADLVVQSYVAGGHVAPIRIITKNEAMVVVGLIDAEKYEDARALTAHRETKFFEQQYYKAMVAHAYAAMGKDEEASEFLDFEEETEPEYKLPADDKGAYLCLAEGYAKAGNHKKIQEMYQHKKLSMDDVIDCYNLVGNTNRADYLKTYKMGPETFGPHITKRIWRSGVDPVSNAPIEKILDTYLLQRKLYTDSKDETKKYKDMRFFGKSFEQKEKAVLALKAALKGEQVDLMEHLPTLRNGDLGRVIRAYVKAGRAGEGVTTVREYIESLHNQVNPSSLSQN